MTMARAGLARLLSRRREVLSRRVMPGAGCLASRLVDPSFGAPPSPAPSAGSLFGLSSFFGLQHRSASSASPPKAGRKGDGVYLHHSDVGSAVYSAGLAIGLMQALQTLRPGSGFFRPIDVTSHGGRRAELIRDIFGIKTPVEDMMGCTQEQAQEMIMAGRLDDLFETILGAYERCRKHHDYVVVEGTSMRDGSNTASINGTLAATLGCPAIILNDAESAASGLISSSASQSVSWEDVNWEKEAVNSVVEHSRTMETSNVDVVGALFYRVPRTSRAVSRLKELLSSTKLPFLGGIPEDDRLEGLQLEDLRRILDSEILYGDSDEAFLATDINKVLVATLHLEDFLSHIPSASTPTEGTVVITHASRPDVLLGCMAIHETNLPTHLAGLILTGGSYPPIDVDTIIRAQPTPSTLPVLLSSLDTSETVMKIANAKAEIHPTSFRKIERAEVLFQKNVDLEALNTALFHERPMTMNDKMFQHFLFSKAREIQQHIVLPEGEEPRTVQAAGELLRRGLCKLTLLGDVGKIQARARQARVDLTGAELVDPRDSSILEELAQMVFEMRKTKGLSSVAIARDHIAGEVNVFGTAMVAAGYADGMVSGAIHTTAATVRPALQIIKTLPGTPIVSSVFFMCLPDKILVYGDCAINEDPNPEQLATIAISSAETARAFGIEPRVAMLSYATGDSNSGPIIQKVADATAIAKELRPDLLIEGPLQYDAAVNPDTARTKMKGKETEVAGKANVLIFPDLNTGNNTYKAVQQSTGAVAMGPVLQGLKKPVNDLSRGCTVKDIVTTVAITAVQAHAMKAGK